MKILKFYTTWCQPCKALTALIGDTSPFPIENIDIEKDTVMRNKYAIKGVPTCVLLDDNGVEVKRKSGLMNISAFKAFCEVPNA